MLPTPPAAPVTSTSPPASMPWRSSAITHSMAVKPAVPMAMACRGLMPSGSFTSHSDLARARAEKPPDQVSPTPQPVRIT